MLPETELFDVFGYIVDLAGYMAHAEARGEPRPDYLMVACPRCQEERPVLIGEVVNVHPCPACLLTAYLKNPAVPFAREVRNADPIELAGYLMNDQFQAAIVGMIGQISGMPPVDEMYDWRAILRHWHERAWRPAEGEG